MYASSCSPNLGSPIHGHGPPILATRRGFRQPVCFAQNGNMFISSAHGQRVARTNQGRAEGKNNDGIWGCTYPAVTSSYGSLPASQNTLPVLLRRLDGLASPSLTLVVCRAPFRTRVRIKPLNIRPNVNWRMSHRLIARFEVVLRVLVALITVFAFCKPIECYVYSQTSTVG
ncbi:hypothetical protein BDZ89DRAFT_786515 [Hymenopellis radicata]|nr:hypothetical protein BDZ89DRAFT_786515 [Hymenopellis radicata]